jgi:hypothetical protein
MATKPITVITMTKKLIYTGRLFLIVNENELMHNTFERTSLRALFEQSNFFSFSCSLLPSITIGKAEIHLTTITIVKKEMSTERRIDGWMNSMLTTVDRVITTIKKKARAIMVAIRRRLNNLALLGLTCCHTCNLGYFTT